MAWPHGVCVALDIERPAADDEWLARATLSLATMRGAIDDSLWLEGASLWLVRRYPADIDDAELEASLAQQQAIARWLSGKAGDAPAVASGKSLGALR